MHSAGTGEAVAGEAAAGEAVEKAVKNVSVQQEATVALGCASSNSYASLALSKLSVCIITRYTHAKA